MKRNGGLDITPFKNILNEFYSRDISKKVKSGKHIRALEGYGTNRIGKVLYERKIPKPKP